MKLSRIGRISMALVVSVAMGLGMTACGGGTVGFMWVIGTQYNQISGFKIDNYTGNLTEMPKQPFTSGGANPVSLVVKPGGRYLYVINKGVTPTSGNSSGNPSCGTSGSVAEFSIGGNGVLTFQQCFATQGSTPVWGSMDSTGGFLYVLDQYAPDAICAPAPNATATSCHGSITVFSIADDTGRLTLVPNKQVKNADGTQLTYFPVGNTPTMMKVAGTGCLFTLDSGDQTVFPYSIGTGGQLTLPTNTTISTGPNRRLTSINASGSYVYLTDAAATTDSPGGYILPYTVGTGCSLNTVTGGQVANLPGTSNPTNTLVNSKTRYLYVLNQSTTNSNAQAFSSISAFSIDPTTGVLQQLANTAGKNPYTVGAGPTCMVEDPSNQYVYTSDYVGNTVTGLQLYDPSGELQPLRRGKTFTVTGQPTCLAVSGNVN
jgi:6-phosphogluconolactonase (cycloisomerase 2 family)